jgi:hypothetical protein
MAKNKVNTAKYEILKCRSCLRCKSIEERKTPGFNYWYSTGCIYLIICDDGFTRICEVGEAKPSGCLIDEENWESWDSNET